MGSTGRLYPSSLMDMVVLKSEGILVSSALRDDYGQGERWRRGVVFWLYLNVGFLEAFCIVQNSTVSLSSTTDDAE